MGLLRFARNDRHCEERKRRNNLRLGIIGMGKTGVAGLGAALFFLCSSLQAIDASPRPVPLRQSLSSAHFRAIYPARTERHEIEAVLDTLEAVRADLWRRLRVASLHLTKLAMLEVVVHATTQDFIAATGQPGWVAAVTHGGRVELQPLRVLRRRGVLTTTLRHEYAHAVIESLGCGRTPRWLAEGLSTHVAGEGAMFAHFEPTPKLTRDDIERGLVHPASAQEMRFLYAAAYREVRALIRAKGEAGTWRLVARCGEQGPRKRNH